MSLMVSLELEFCCLLVGCVDVVGVCEVPELLGIDEGGGVKEGVDEGPGVALGVVGGVVLLVEGGVSGAVVLPESVGSADPPGACGGVITVFAMAEPVA